MSEQLSNLKMKRKIIKGSLTRFRNHFDTVKDLEYDDAMVAQLSLRLEKIEPAWDQFNEIQIEIETLESVEDDEEERSNFETAYFSVVGEAKASIKNYERKCRKAHNVLLHLVPRSVNNKVDENNEGTTPALRDDTGPDSASISCMSGGTDSPQVLLSSAVKQVKNNANKYVSCRALLDSGSQSNFITESACKRLGLKPVKISQAIKGVGETLTIIQNKVNKTFKSCNGEFTQGIDCLILSKITENLPLVTFKENFLSIPKTIRLADPNFNISAEVDILLGSAVFWTILCSGQERLGRNLPILQNTRLGWIIAGNFGLSCSNMSLTHLTTRHARKSTDEILERFWQLEEASKNKLIMSNDEKYCETYFHSTTRRNKDGRFIVKLPLKQLVSQLGSSREIALRRFEQLERRLRKNPKLKAEYAAFMS